jgi:hypothetical protein
VDTMRITFHMPAPCEGPVSRYGFNRPGGRRYPWAFVAYADSPTVARYIVSHATFGLTMQQARAWADRKEG